MGTTNTNFGIPAVCGVLRDANYDWILGYAKKLGVTSVFQAEARAHLEGLQVVWAKGFKMVEVESYNALLIEVVCSEHAASNGVEAFGSWLHIHDN